MICRRLANLMGGDVTLESVPGTGTTMRVLVPLAVGDPAAIEAHSAPRTQLADRRVKPPRAVAEQEGSVVLLAEDHPVNQTVIRRQLDMIGFHVDVADDGEEAFDRFVTGRYGLVLSDLNMPRMNGCQLAEAIRRYERRQGRKRTPLIALSANVMQGEAEKTRAAGMDDFMAKPTTILNLGAKLRHWLPDVAWEPVTRDVATASADALHALDVLTSGDEEMASAVLEDFLTTSLRDVGLLDEAIGERRARMPAAWRTA